MPIVLDTGILYAWYDRSDDWHPRSRELIRAERAALIVPSPVIPEVDFLLGKRLGPEARRMFLRGFTEGHFRAVDLTSDLFARAIEIDLRFAELDLGFVDAAVLAAAEQTGIRRIATTDRRDFDPVARALAIEILP